MKDISDSNFIPSKIPDGCIPIHLNLVVIFYQFQDDGFINYEGCFTTLLFFSVGISSTIVMFYGVMMLAQEMHDCVEMKGILF